MWLTFGEVIGKVVVAREEVLDPSAAASAAPLPLTSLVRTGDWCEWVPEEESTTDDIHDKDEDEGDLPPTRRLAVLAAENKKGSVVVVLKSCQTCDLLLGLADKAMIALGKWKVVSTKLSRSRADTPPNAPPQPTAMALTLGVPVRLCVNRAAPSLCLQQRKIYLPKLLALCNIVLVAQISKDRQDHDDTSANTTFTTQPQQQQQQQHTKPDTGQSRLAQIFEEASKAPQSSHLQDDHQQRQQQEPGRRHLLASAAVKRQQPNAPITLLADDMLGLIFSFFDAMDLDRLGDSCHYLSAVTASIIPGLKARLFPHQSRCLEWMLKRETASWKGRQYPDPAWERLEVTMEGDVEKEGVDGVKRGEEDDKGRLEGGRTSLYVNMMTGEVLLEGGRGVGRSMPTLTDVKGGFLCDEPGLGKTVTTLALVLKTADRLPGPLDDDREEEEEDGEAEERKGPRKIGSSRRRTSEGEEGGGAVRGRFHFRSAGKRRREVDPRTLLPTHGTLVISPGHLLQHWREQIERHAEGWALGKDHVFYDDHQGVGGGGGGGRGGGGMRPLPSAEELARYRVVVVTKERLRQEWATGKPASVLDKWAQRYAHHHGDDEEDGKVGWRKLSPLLGLRWLRIVVDEGHSLGSVAITNEALMSKGLEAERRWVMTGTPHRHDVADLASLQELLCFLREASFGLSDSRAWGKLISGRSAGAGAGGGMEELRRRRLVTLLRRIMIRHTKEEIPEIPPPRWNVTRLRMSKVEADTYNTLVSLVQANLITTGMVGGTHAPGVGHPDSHLNPMNRRSANTLLSNIRLACCGGGAQIVTLEQAMVVATLKLAREIYLENRRTIRKGGGEGEVDGAVARVATFLRHMRTNLNTPCDSCGTDLIILLMTPCLHLVCCRCMKGRNNVCAFCGEVFSVDAFQTLQPGLSVHWDESQLNVLPDRVSVEAEESMEDGGHAGACACAGTVVATSSPLAQARQQQGQANVGDLMTVLDEEEGKAEDEDGRGKVMAVVSDGGQRQQLRKHDADAKYLLLLPDQAMGFSPTGAALRAAAASSSTKIPASERNGGKYCKSDPDAETSSMTTLSSTSSFASSSDNMAIICDDGEYSSSSPPTSPPASFKDDTANMNSTSFLSVDANGSSRVVSKAWYMITLLRSYLDQQALTPTHVDYRLPLKAVVFSQFRAYLNRLDDALSDQGFRIGKFYEKNRLIELARFKSVEGEGDRGGLQVLLIGKEGSHGLDLSMATHVFLMDEIWDRNLQNQVVSRAYRMGAQASVRVEKLVMRDTVEEVMEALACGKLVDSAGGFDGGEEEEEGKGEMELDALGEDEGSIPSTFSFPSSCSSLSAMGTGSWGGGGRGAGGQGKGNGRGGRSLTPPVEKPGSGRSKTTAKPVLWLSDRRRSKKNRSRRSGSKDGGVWPGAAEESKLHTLLQSLCLVDVDPVPSPMKIARLNPFGTATGRFNALVAASDGGGGGGGGAGAPDRAVPAASPVKDGGSAGDVNDATAPSARRVRFM